MAGALISESVRFNDAVADTLIRIPALRFMEE